MEEEVVCLRKKLENTQRELSMNTPRMTSIEQLDKILNAQRSPLIKAGIGYEGETSKSKVEDNKNIMFVKAVKDNEAAQKGTTEAEASKNLMCDETSSNIKRQRTK